MNMRENTINTKVKRLNGFRFWCISGSDTGRTALKPLCSYWFWYNSKWNLLKWNLLLQNWSQPRDDLIISVMACLPWEDLCNTTWKHDLPMLSDVHTKYTGKPEMTIRAPKWIMGMVRLIRGITSCVFRF